MEGVCFIIMIAQTQLPIYEGLKTLEQVKYELATELNKMELKPFYRIKLTIGMIHEEYMLFFGFSDNKIESLGFKIVTL